MLAARHKSSPISKGPAHCRGLPNSLVGSQPPKTQAEATSLANAEFQVLQFTLQEEKKEKSSFSGLYLVLSLSPGWCFRLGVTFGLLLASCAGRPCAQASAWEGGKMLQVCPSPRMGELELWPTYSHGGVYSSAKTMRDEAHLLLQRGARGVTWH